MVRLPVSILAFDPTDIFCVCVVHDHSSFEIESQGKRLGIWFGLGLPKNGKAIGRTLTAVCFLPCVPTKKTSVVYNATDHCRKRLEACVNAESGHSEHLL